MATGIQLKRNATTDTGETVLITNPNANAEILENLPFPVQTTFKAYGGTAWCNVFSTITNPATVSGNSVQLFILEGLFHVCNNSDGSGDKITRVGDNLYNGWVVLPSALRKFTAVYSAIISVDIGRGGSESYGATANTRPYTDGTSDYYNKSTGAIGIKVYAPLAGNTSEISINVNARIVGTCSQSV